MGNGKELAELGNILIHPGFHKTGTTFLQNAVFADESTFIRPWDRATVARAIIQPHPLAFEPDAARRDLVGALAAAETRTVVLSEEGLSGNPFIGARGSADLARRLHALFPQARVLLTVRRQSELLPSLYTQYLKEGGRRSPDAFFTPAIYPEFPHFDPGIFCFDRLARAYAQLFGTERLLVLPQELLRQDQTAFLAALARFIDTGPLSAAVATDRRTGNTSPSIGNGALFRIGNRFLRSPFNETGTLARRFTPARVIRSMAYALPSSGEKERARVAAAIAPFVPQFEQSNRNLQAFCPVDLARFGYFEG